MNKEKRNKWADMFILISNITFWLAVVLFVWISISIFVSNLIGLMNGFPKDIHPLVKVVVLAFSSIIFKAIGGLLKTE